MSPSQHDSLFPDSPGEFLASWSATRGNLRRFLGLSGERVERNIPRPAV